MVKLRIERWHPAKLNQLMRHWRTRSRLQTIDRNMISGYCLLNRIPVAIGPREVKLTIILGPNQRASDVDAYWKSTLDALKRAKMLIDDSRHWCRILPVEYARGTEKETIIELRDIA